MKQESTLDKQKQGKRITDSAVAIRLRDKIYPFMMFLTGTKVRCKIEMENFYSPIPNKSIIFAANHSAFQDTPIALRVTKRRSYVFSGKQNLSFVDWLFFVLNGAIWVDRNNKEDMMHSKDALIEYLEKKQSILWFPEGTWNLSPNLLMLPMKWGIVDIARTANAQIIPVALDYNWEKNLCRVKFGEPIADKILENKADAIRTLRDMLATLRWDMMSEQDLLCRSQVTTEELKKDMHQVTEAYRPLEWERESACIYNPYPEVEYIPKNMKVNRNNVFLLAKDR